MEANVDLSRTLFIVSSKSGGTTEPNVLKDYFFDRVSKAIGADRAGHRFVAVTDPGSSLEKTAKQQGFAPHLPWRTHDRRTLFRALGRSASCRRPPRASMSRTLLEHTLSMVRSCGADVPPHENPGVQLGLAMGLAGLEGRDKLTIVSSKKIADFGAWAEQLIAESTGKEGKGLIPVDGEPLGEPAVYGNDRLFIDLRTDGEDDAAHDEKLTALEQAGHPVVRIVMKSIDHIGQEFFRLEIATAVAGAVLGINPFDQPDVEAAKIKTRELTAAFEKTGIAPGRAAGGLDRSGRPLYRRARTPPSCARPAPTARSAPGSRRIWPRSERGDYVALLAYIERDRGQHRRAATGCGLPCATRSTSRPAPNSARASCIRPARPTRAGRTAACSCRSRPTTPRICRCRARRRASASIKAAQARGDFDVSPSAAGARCGFI